MEFDLHTALSTAGGGGITLLLAKAFLRKSQQDSEDIKDTVHETNDTVQELKKDMAVISVKLQSLEKIDNILRSHDRKIASLETKIHGQNIKSVNYSSSDCVN